MIRVISSFLPFFAIIIFLLSPVKLHSTDNRGSYSKGFVQESQTFTPFESYSVINLYENEPIIDSQNSLYKNQTPILRAVGDPCPMCRNGEIGSDGKCVVCDYDTGLATGTPIPDGWRFLIFASFCYFCCIFLKRRRQMKLIP